MDFVNPLLDVKINMSNIFYMTEMSPYIFVGICTKPSVLVSLNICISTKQIIGHLTHHILKVKYKVKQNIPVLSTLISPKHHLSYVSPSVAVFNLHSFILSFLLS